MTVEQLKSEIEQARQSGREELLVTLTPEHFTQEMFEYLSHEITKDDDIYFGFTDFVIYYLLEFNFLSAKSEADVDLEPEPFLQGHYSALQTLIVQNELVAHGNAIGMIRYAIRLRLEKLGISFWPGMRALEKDYQKRGAMPKPFMN